MANPAQTWGLSPHDRSEPAAGGAAASSST